MSTTQLLERTATVDEQELLETAHLLRHRAESLRTQADRLDPVLASTYRRRASELELESFVAELQAGVPYSQVQMPAA